MAREAKASHTTLRLGELVIDLERYQVLLDGFPVILAYRDYGLLVYLASRMGQVVSKRQLLEEGLGRHDPEGLSVVDERIQHLKRLLERPGHQLIVPEGDMAYRVASI
jgi:DNA-binding response OmpR family regulator